MNTANRSAAPPPPAETLAHAHADAFSPGEGPVERICRLICEFGIVLLMLMVGAELLTRGIFGFSLQISGELGGYFLLGIAFLSIPVGQARHAFHRVEFVDSRLGQRAQALLRLLFDMLALVVVVVLAWQFLRLELESWRSGEIAATNLMTPLWLPRCLMPLGAAALLWTMSRAILGDVRRLRALAAVASDTTA